MGEELKAIHARRIWLDATSIVGLVLAVVMTTWTVSGERNQINARLDKLTADITELTVKQSAVLLQNKDRWSRSDQAQLLVDWCYRAEKENLNWKCPQFRIKEPYEAPDNRP
jgi:outer membrane murein-binding lipoprotein Lpp